MGTLHVHVHAHYMHANVHVHVHVKVNESLLVMTSEYTNKEIVS